MLHAKMLAVAVKKDLDKVTKTDLQTFFHGLEKRGLKETSIFNSKMYLRCFYKVLLKVKEGTRKEDLPDVISWMEFKKNRIIKKGESRQEI